MLVSSAHRRRCVVRFVTSSLQRRRSYRCRFIVHRRFPEWRFIRQVRYSKEFQRNVKDEFATLQEHDRKRPDGGSGPRQPATSSRVVVPSSVRRASRRDRVRESNQRLELSLFATECHQTSLRIRLRTLASISARIGVRAYRRTACSLYRRRSLLLLESQIRRWHDLLAPKPPQLPSLVLSASCSSAQSVTSSGRLSVALHPRMNVAELKHLLLTRTGLASGDITYGASVLTGDQSLLTVFGLPCSGSVSVDVRLCGGGVGDQDTPPPNPVTPAPTSEAALSNHAALPSIGAPAMPLPPPPPPSANALRLRERRRRASAADRASLAAAKKRRRTDKKVRVAQVSKPTTGTNNFSLVIRFLTIPSPTLQLLSLRAAILQPLRREPCHWIRCRCLLPLPPSPAPPLPPPPPHPCKRRCARQHLLLRLTPSIVPPVPPCRVVVLWLPALPRFQAGQYANVTCRLSL